MDGCGDKLARAVYAYGKNKGAELEKHITLDASQKAAAKGKASNIR